MKAPKVKHPKISNSELCAAVKNSVNNLRDVVAYDWAMPLLPGAKVGFQLGKKFHKGIVASVAITDTGLMFEVMQKSGIFVDVPASDITDDLSNVRSRYVKRVMATLYPALREQQPPKKPLAKTALPVSKVPPSEKLRAIVCYDTDGAPWRLTLKAKRLGALFMGDAPQLVQHHSLNSTDYAALLTAVHAAPDSFWTPRRGADEDHADAPTLVKSSARVFCFNAGPTECDSEPLNLEPVHIADVRRPVPDSTSRVYSGYVVEDDKGTRHALVLSHGTSIVLRTLPADEEIDKTDGYLGDDFRTLSSLVNALTDAWWVAPFTCASDNATVNRVLQKDTLQTFSIVVNRTYHRV